METRRARWTWLAQDLFSLLLAVGTAVPSTFAAEEPAPPYDPQPIAMWDAPDGMTVVKIIDPGVVAYASSGIERVDFSLDQVVRVSVRQETISRWTNEKAFVYANLDTTPLTNGKHVVGATVYANNGFSTALPPLTIQVANGVPFNTLYVDAVKGSDAAGAGSTTKPFATVARAYAAAKGGDTILLRDGDYALDATKDYKFTQFVTVKPDANQTQVRVTGVKFPVNSGFLKFVNLTFDLSSQPCATSGYIYRSYGKTHHWFDGVTIQGPPGCFNYYVSAIMCDIACGDLTVERSAFKNVDRAVTSSAKGLTIVRGNDMGPLTSDAIDFCSSNHLLTGNEMHDIQAPTFYIESQNSEPFNVAGLGLNVYYQTPRLGAGYLAYAAGNLGATALNPSQATAQDIAKVLNELPAFAANLVASDAQGKLRISAKTTNYPSCAYVTGSANNALGFTESDPDTAVCGSGQHADIFQTWCPTDQVIIRNNNIHDVLSQGVLVDGGLTRHLAVVNNLFDKDDIKGLWTMWLGGPGDTLQNVLIAHNTVWGNGPDVILGTGGVFQDVWIQNNALGYQTTNGETLPTMGYNAIDTYVTPQKLGPNSFLTNPLKLQPSPVSQLFQGVTYNTATKAYTGDFHLAKSSALRDRGNAAFGITYDLDWKPRDAAPDVGAYEYAVVNQPPVVDAGPDQALPRGVRTATLAGAATDDGLPNPPGQLTTTWKLMSGPGSATFAGPAALTTTVTVNKPGTYVLRLTASDGALSASDDMAVTVTRKE